MQVVIKTVEETLAEVHVTDGVNAFGELDAARNLTVAVSPVVLDALHVPLVDNNYDLIALCVVDLTEQILILLVDKDLLQLWEEHICGLNEPVHVVGVEALLTESSRADHGQLLSVRQHLVGPS